MYNASLWRLAETLTTCCLGCMRCSTPNAILVREWHGAGRSRATNAILFFGPACILRCCCCAAFFACICFVLCSLAGRFFFFVLSVHTFILLLLFSAFASMMDRVPLGCCYYCCIECGRCLPFARRCVTLCHSRSLSRATECECQLVWCISCVK